MLNRLADGSVMKVKGRQYVKHLNGNLLDCRKENMVFADRKDDASVKSLIQYDLIAR